MTNHRLVESIFAWSSLEAVEISALWCLQRTLLRQPYWRRFDAKHVNCSVANGFTQTIAGEPASHRCPAMPWNTPNSRLYTFMMQIQKPIYTCKEFVTSVARCPDLRRTSRLLGVWCHVPIHPRSGRWMSQFFTNIFSFLPLSISLLAQ